MSGPRLRLLDEVVWEGRPVAGERTAALLRALAEVGERGLSAEALADALWPDDPPANPAKALQVVVSRARTATAPEVIDTTPTGYRLGLGTADVDVWSLRPDALRRAREGDHAGALPLLERLLADTPFDDEVVEAAIRATAAAHGVPAGLHRYEEYRARLADLLGVDPAPRLRSLHAELLARDRPIREGLRHDADPLVGRVDELAELRALVRGHRLVTLLGAGGLGKTRLAHLIGRQAEQPVVHFIELVSVTDDGKVALEVADALGAREANTVRRASAASRTDRDDPVERTVGLLSEAPTLLILDNCEQVVAGVADLVATLLARLPQLTVLTTSRSPLELIAEQVFALPELSADDAATLFRQRARAGRPGIVLDPEAVSRIVARLDGLPLAVELAAAQTRMLSLSEIERRLDDRFALLRAESRDLPDRHRTLLAVIDWSWQLLRPEEQAALARLAVCRDDVGLDAAAAVIGVAPDEALELLRSLVNQSLVVLVETDGGMRFRLLETVREFGSARLAASGEEDSTRRRYVAWALDFCDAVHQDLFSTLQATNVRRIRQEEGLLLDVLRQLMRERDIDAVAVVAGTLGGFWTIVGAHLKFGQIGLPAALAVAGSSEPPQEMDAARALVALAVTVSRIFIGSAPMALVARLREWGFAGAPPFLSALVRVTLAYVEVPSEQAMESLRALVDDPDDEVARLAAIWLSQFLENLGEMDEAWEISVAAQRRTGGDSGPWHSAMLNGHLASLALQRGRYEDARRYADAGLPVMEDFGAVDDWTQLKSIQAITSIAQGRVEEAESLVAELDSHDVRDDLGGLFARLCVKAELLLAQGRVAEGLLAYRDTVTTLVRRQAEHGDQPVGYEPWVLLPTAAAVMAHLKAGRSGDAESLHDVLEEQTGQMRTREGVALDTPVLGAAEIALGCWEILRGNPGDGEELVTSGLARHPSQLLPSVDLAWARSLISG